MNRNVETVISNLNQHKSLSSNSLRTAFEWAENNEENNPLADAYMKACILIGGFDLDEIQSMLEKELTKGVSDTMKSARTAYNISFIYRDTIGRAIIDMLELQIKEGEE